MRTLAAAASAALLVTGLVTVPADPALASDCHRALVTASGAVRNVLTAKRSARRAWTSKVREELGEDWASWRLARGKTYDCATAEGSFLRRACIARARPCRAP